MQRDFGGVIWTNHALERLRQRNISQGDAWATFNSPDQSRKASTKGAWVYYKTYGQEKLEVVASKNDQGKWVIMTVWSRPLYQSSGNYKPKQNSTWDRLLENLLRKVFGRG